jgi:uncharacterized protein
LDAKAHRKEGIFEMKALYLEPHVLPTEALAIALRTAIQRTAKWHGTPKIVTGQSEPPEFAELLKDVKPRDHE